MAGLKLPPRNPERVAGTAGHEVVVIVQPDPGFLQARSPCNASGDQKTKAAGWDPRLSKSALLYDSEAGLQHLLPGTGAKIIAKIPFVRHRCRAFL